MEVNISSCQGTVYCRSTSGVGAKLNVYTCFYTRTRPTGTLQQTLATQINLCIYLFIYGNDNGCCNLAMGSESVLQRCSSLPVFACSIKYKKHNSAIHLTNFSTEGVGFNPVLFFFWGGVYVIWAWAVTCFPAAEYWSGSGGLGSICC